jgi:hypothetical protein
MVTAGAPHYRPPLETPSEEARRGLTEHLLLALEVARGAADKVRPPGSLVFMGGTGARRPRPGLGIASTATVAFPILLTLDERSYDSHFSSRELGWSGNGDGEAVESISIGGATHGGRQAVAARRTPG